MLAHGAPRRSNVKPPALRHHVHVVSRIGIFEVLSDRYPAHLCFFALSCVTEAQKQATTLLATPAAASRRIAALFVGSPGKMLWRLARHITFG
jgi:hypothetical protein